ncbi:hypothetical protein EVAR_66636_1 [Eumeta japonica]|uniref:PiggyBac transposable element-derived protein 4 n=1 Tax=Eumeta variegata TaxID=151549 RepID=A0A4C1ZZN7_EUMVA|nr:hypothetical protein EVAR_66636_1 [Eumeta japonica]
MGGGDHPHSGDSHARLPLRNATKRQSIDHKLIESNICTENESDDMENDWENASLDQCLLESLARGRPKSRLRGKNGFVWSTKLSHRRSVRIAISTIFGKTRPDDGVERVELPSKKRCGLCLRSKDRKTCMQCPACEQPICNDDRMYLCIDCGGHD